MNQLESTLVLTLREAIPWDASLEISTTGTLEPVNPDAVFSAAAYQKRDRQLAFRDLVNAAAVAAVSIRVSDVWNYPALQPVLQGPVGSALYNNPSEQLFSGTCATVRHVGYTSVPYDAARYTDKDLYGRDAIVYETLAQACSIFSEPPVASIDAAGTIPAVTAWSLAEGSDDRADINSALPLNRDLFKKPDRNLADRDNQMAGYVAAMAQILKNPFQHATRIYVQVSVVDEREPEIYTLIRVYWEAGELYAAGDEVYNGTKWYRALTATNAEPPNSTWVEISEPSERIFCAEPALSNRNRIVYDVEGKTLQWFRESTSAVHVPQIVALSIPGIDVGQELDTLPRIPEMKDAQYWRTKAGQIVPAGTSLTDELALDFTASDKASGGYIQVPAASMTVPDTVTFELPGALQAGSHQVSILVNPSPLVEIAGAQNIQGTSGTLGGATFEVNPASITEGTIYIVDGGLGVVYDSQTYPSGSTFTGGAASSYTRLAGTTLRQYSCAWKMALPSGAWTARIDYTNLVGTTSGFGVRALYAPPSLDPITVIEDTVPLAFSEDAGVVVSSASVGFDVASTAEFTFPLYWTYGSGQLHVRQIVFESTDIANGHYIMSGTLGTSVSDADVIGEAYHPDILSFYFTTGVISDPAVLTVAWSEEAQLPIQMKSVQVQAVGTYTPTPNAGLFQGWRQEMVDRAADAIQNGFARSVLAFGTNTPNFVNDDGTWDAASTESYMAYIEVMQPRLREISSVASGDITEGRQYVVDGGPVVYGGDTYVDGDKFYGTEASGRTFTGATVHQVGALMKARPGHVGRPAVLPSGLYYSQLDQTVRCLHAGSHCAPQVASCQPWMLDSGIYTFQSEFWMPENT